MKNDVCFPYHDGSITFGWCFLDLMKHVFRPTITVHKYSIAQFIYDIIQHNSMIDILRDRSTSTIFIHILRVLSWWLFYYENVIRINICISGAVDVCIIFYIILGCFMVSISGWFWCRFWDVGLLPLIGIDLNRKLDYSSNRVMDTTLLTGKNDSFGSDLKGYCGDFFRHWHS